jgi:aminoglycoside phosphotransferase (APT) family kinase protein
VSAEAEQALYAGLVRMGLIAAGDRPALCPLEGGISSEIVRIELAGRTICVKRALPRLKVAALWEAPIARNAFEAEWMRVAGTILPDAVPALLAEDRSIGMLAMEYLEPSSHPVWKSLLMAGDIDLETAAAVGNRIGRIHAATAGDPDIAARFATDAAFHAIRLDPYLGATARAQPRYAARLEALIATTAATRRVLVHGDVSPKNILVGPDGPVFLDAECAWYGDPAFDLAFCLNHLLLKCLWRRADCARYLDAFAALTAGYLARVDWEAPAGLETRAAALLPGLLLARIDGKSPVEYVTDPAQQALARRFAMAALEKPPQRLADCAARWGKEFEK